MAVISAAHSGSRLKRNLALSDPAVWILATLIAATLFLYWDTFRWLGEEWSSTSSEFSHGYLVAAVSVFLLYSSMSRLQRACLKPAWWAVTIATPS